MWLTSILIPWFLYTRSAASLMTVNVLSPRKSIFKSPSSSMVVMINCVVIVPSDALDSGTYSSIAFCEITTPAACIEVCRGSPSKRFDISISVRTFSSDSYMPRSSGFICSAFSIVIFSSFGIIFAIVSQKLYGRSITRPTSRITPFAASVPNVTICETQSLPYFFTT